MHLTVTRGDPRLVVALTLALLTLLIPSPASAEITPSSDVLVPYFEVAADGDGLTTLFAAGNASGKAVDVEIAVWTNWGIPVITTTLRLDAQSVDSFDLADWIVAGKVPGIALTPADLEHVQAALTGRRSPRDQMFYGTETSPGIAAGYVTIRVAGTDRPDVLWGDYYRIDFGRDQFQAETLVNLDPATESSASCTSHGLRFVNGAPISQVMASSRGAARASDHYDTELVIWTGKSFSPSDIAEPWGPKVAAKLTIYSETGDVLSTSSHNLISVQTLKIDDLAAADTYGWINVETDVPSHVAEHIHSALAPSAEIHSYCIPPQKAECITEGKATLEFSINGDPADNFPGPLVDRGSTLTFLFDVSNTGTTPLTDISVTHDWGAAMCPKTKLEPGESMTCMASGPAVDDHHENVGILRAQSACGAIEVRDSVHYHTPPRGNPGIDLVKVVHGPSGPTASGQNGHANSFDVGATLEWTFVVTNTGDTTLYDVAVEDFPGSTPISITCPAGPLAPGESRTCGPMHSLALPCEHSNTARAHARIGLSDPTEVSDVDTASYYGVGHPAMEFARYIATEQIIAVYGPFRIRNTGDVALSDLVVTKAGFTITCAQTTLEVGESTVCTPTAVETPDHTFSPARAQAKSPCGDLVIVYETVVG